LLSCVEICGFRVLSTATKLTTAAVSLVSPEGHATTPNSDMQGSLDQHRSLVLEI
jgi:hypothetical protein